jgi:hypothetical protein
MGVISCSKATGTISGSFVSLCVENSARSNERLEPTSATGTGWERTPWHATQRAAWEALKKAETN